MNIYDAIGRFGWYSLLEGTDRAGAGNTWFVDGNSGNAANNANAGQGASWSAPFKTLNYAISRCSDDASDVIFVAANHTESWSTAETASGTTTTGCCADKNGITIIGLGSGDRRPTFTFTAAAGTLYVDATEVTIYNLIFYSNYEDHASHIDAQANSQGLLVENCKFYDASAITESVSGIIITANCHDVTIRGNRFYNVDTNSGSDEAILLEGASHRLKIIDNVFDGDWNEEVINGEGAASTEVEICNNIINNIDAGVAVAIKMYTGSTGVIANNIIHNAAGGSGGGAIVTDGCLVSGNRVAVNEGQNATEIPGSIGGTKIGNHWYVDSGTGVATNSGTSWADAVTTVDVAIGLATASNGDIIHVAAGHEEDITGGAGYLFDMDKKGISVVGEGIGNARPTFTFKTDAANGIVDLTEDDCRISNCRFIAGVASLAECILLSGDDCEIDHCEFLGTGSYQPLTCITIGGASDGLADNAYIHHNEFKVTTAGTGVSAIDIIKDEDGIRIEDNYVRGDFDNACIEIDAGGDACTDLRIVRNVLVNAQTGDHCIEISGVTVTGMIAGNIFICDTRDQATQPSLCQMIDNKWSKLGTGMVGMDNVDPKNAGIHFFVDSGATGAGTTAGHGYSWAEPLSTLAAAIALCTSNAGDVIHLAPGHAENVASAGAITVNKTGITILGHGQGSDRPTFTFITSVDADIEIDNANVTFENIIFVQNKDAIVGPLDVDAAHCTFKKCVFRDTSTQNTLDWIVGDANADYLTVEDCVNEGTDTAGNNSWVQVDGSAYLTVRNCVSHGNFVVANIGVVNTACTDVLITGNHLENSNAIDVNIELFAASTGWVSNNYCKIVTDAEVSWVNTPGNTYLFENYGVNSNGETGILAGTPSV